MLEEVKKALRITGNDFDTEVTLLINSCLENLASLGIVVDKAQTTGVPTSYQVQLAVIAYCKWLFGDNESADRWRQIYDRCVGEMQMMTGLTVWDSSAEA